MHGQIWMEEIFKKDKLWTIVANYTEAGQKWEAGTLKSGDGSILLYNEDGPLRETNFFRAGVEISQ
ncbi:MAG: hypothetical protein ABJB86_02340 [Bacteroidota bacterium]